MKLLRRPISASDRIPDRFYVISMEFLSLSRRRSSARNVPGGEERVETDVFEGYPVSRKKIKTTGLHNFALFVFPLTCNHNSAFERQRGIIKFSILFLLNRVGVYCTHFL